METARQSEHRGQRYARPVGYSVGDCDLPLRRDLVGRRREILHGSSVLVLWTCQREEYGTVNVYVVDSYTAEGAAMTANSKWHTSSFKAADFTAADDSAVKISKQ